MIPRLLIGVFLALASWGLALAPAHAVIIIQDRAAAVTYARDWSGYADALWTAENEAAGDPANDTGIGGNDDLTNNGTVGRETLASLVRFGSKSFGVASGSNYFSCTDANCPTADFGAGTAYTIGCAGALYNTATSTTKYVFSKTASNAGYTLGFRPTASSGELQCTAGRTGGTITANHGTATGINTWYGVACTIVDGATTVVTPFLNAIAAGSASHANAYNPTSVDFKMPNSTSTQFTGNLDDCWIIAQEMTAPEISRVNSCGWDGKLCACVDATSANYKPCDTNADCGGTAICDTNADADDNCIEGTSAGCCMGWYNTLGGGLDASPCNTASP